MTVRQVPGQLPLWEPPAPAPRRLPTHLRRHFLTYRDAPARPATRPGPRRIHGRRIRTLIPPEEYL